ncbi:MAG: endonuclease III domain-containing protein [Desulfovibrionaceae bacterium]|nr:endonuclease III domain-containing protein [Desulfovibrionaceae bacterium]
MTTSGKTLLSYYEAMLESLGPSRWWPGEHPLEIAVGAVLTQNTAWKNVEKALDRLRRKNALRLDSLLNMPLEEMEEALRPSGFFRLKAQRLRNLLLFFSSFPGWNQNPEAGRLDFLQTLSTQELRKALLHVHGVGPETADCILLYALDRPSFVIDAYTRRICGRHGFFPDDVPYGELREFFMRALPVDVSLYNEYHALLVRTGNRFCKNRKPLCAECPLGKFLKPGSFAAM